MSTECKTTSVPKAGKDYLGLSRGASYAAARRGDVPVVKIGRKLRVPIAAMKRLLDTAMAKSEATR